MESAVIIRSVISELNSQQHKSGASLHLSIPSDYSEFRWHDRNLKNEIGRFLAYVLESSQSKRAIRIAVHEMKSETDLERLFSISPCCRFRLSIESQANTDFEAMTKKILKDLGYRCSEWVGMEESQSQPGDFRLGTKDSPALILFIQNHGTRRNCDFLIPATD
jgi:hypothetical protein